MIVCAHESAGPEVADPKFPKKRNALPRVLQCTVDFRSNPVTSESAGRWMHEYTARARINGVVGTRDIQSFAMQ